MRKKIIRTKKLWVEDDDVDHKNLENIKSTYNYANSLKSYLFYLKIYFNRKDKNCLSVTKMFM